MFHKLCLVHLNNVTAENDVFTVGVFNSNIEGQSLFTDMPYVHKSMVYEPPEELTSLVSNKYEFETLCIPIFLRLDSQTFPQPIKEGIISPDWFQADLKSSQDAAGWTVASQKAVDS